MNNPWMFRVGMLLLLFTTVLNFINLRKKRGGTYTGVDRVWMILSIAVWGLFAIVVLVRYFG